MPATVALLTNEMSQVFLLGSKSKNFSTSNRKQITWVDDFVSSVNLHLTTRQENERLKGIMARIESYDVVVSFSL